MSIVDVAAAAAAAAAVVVGVCLYIVVVFPSNPEWASRPHPGDCGATGQCVGLGVLSLRWNDHQHGLGVRARLPSRNARALHCVGPFLEPMLNAQMTNAQMTNAQINGKCSVTNA